MNLILLGAPGAGKGTQAEKICAKLSIPAISTGNIIREAIKNGTKVGLEAKRYIESGDLVPDEVVIGIIKERLECDDCQNGFILDGFPRTIPQAEALNSMGVRIDTVLEIDVKDEAVVSRLSGRRVCEKCGASYHIQYKQPKEESVCDLCGGNLVMRKDDNPDTIRERLKVYHDQTEPLKDFYKNLGKLKVVEGQEEVADTTALVFKTLEL